MMRGGRVGARAMVMCALAAIGGRELPGQAIARADSLLAAGVVARAESIYYAQADARPRDPIARIALGRYLAGRGATRVAGVLLEEALRFGGNPRDVAPTLAAVDMRLNDYQALLTLRGGVLSAAERARARWLVDHAWRIVAPDTALMASYRATPGEPEFVGRVLVRIDGDAVDARISPRAVGLVVADTSAVAKRLRRFRDDSSRAAATIAAVADSVGFGRLVVINVPVTIQHLDVSAVIGVDMLGRFAPTFDARAGRVTLRTAGTIDDTLRVHQGYATFLGPAGIVLLVDGRWRALGDPSIEQMLNTRRWTFDAKRGLIRFDR